MDNTKNSDSKFLISIIVPVYNVSLYLDACLNSIRKQSYTNFECILVDDGSTDSSGEICDKYANLDARFKVIHKINGGAHAARLEGYKQAQGEFIGFVDADDWIEPDMYEKLIASMYDDIDITIGCFIQECQGSTPMETRGKWGLTTLNSEYALAHALTRRIFAWELWCKLFRKKLFDESVFPILASVGDDMITSCYLFQRARKVVYIPDDVYHYRLHPESMTHDSAIDVELKFIESLQMIIRDRNKLSGPIQNYLLYWYAYLLKKKIIDIYVYEQCYIKRNKKKLFYELKKTIREIDNDWLDKGEKIITPIIIGTELEDLVRDIKKRNIDKCYKFAKKKDVYIFGAGKYALKLKDELIKNGFKIKGFIVSDIKENMNKINGARVVALKDILNMLPVMYIFIGVSHKYALEISQVLMRNGARHFYWPPMLRSGWLDSTRLERAKDRMLSLTY